MRVQVKNPSYSKTPNRTSVLEDSLGPASTEVCLPDQPTKIWLQNAYHSSTEVAMLPRAAHFSLRFWLVGLVIFSERGSSFQAICELATVFLVTTNILEGYDAVRFTTAEQVMTNVNLSEKAQEANKALDKLDHLSKTKLKEHINRRCLRNQIDLARNMVVHGSEQGILDGLRDLRSYIKCSFGEDTIQELLSIIEI